MSKEQTPKEDLGAREMPDFVKRGLCRTQGDKPYLRAPYRVLWMREEHPDWSIVTSVEFADYEGGFVVMKAAIFDGEGRTMATAHCEEHRGNGRIPYLRKAETGAIARALGLCGYGTEFGEFDEDEVPESDRGGTGAGYQRAGTAAGSRTGAGQVRVLNQTGAQCPHCHAPDGAAHTSACPETNSRAA